MDELTEDQIKAIWRNEGGNADFSNGPVWKVPIRRSWAEGYERAKNADPTRITPPEEMYVAFRLERGAYGVPGAMGHRVTRVIGRGVVVAEQHHHDKHVFIPFEEAGHGG